MKNQEYASSIEALLEILRKEKSEYYNSFTRENFCTIFIPHEKAMNLDRSKLNNKNELYRLPKSISLIYGNSFAVYNNLYFSAFLADNREGDSQKLFTLLQENSNYFLLSFKKYKNGTLRELNDHPRPLPFMYSGEIKKHIVSFVESLMFALSETIAQNTLIREIGNKTEVRDYRI